MFRSNFFGRLSDEDIQTIEPLLSDLDKNINETKREISDLLDNLETKDAREVSQIVDRKFSLMSNMMNDIGHAVRIAVRMDERKLSKQ